MKTSFIGTMNMLGLAKRTKARFLLTSTSEVYGDPLVHPQVTAPTDASLLLQAALSAVRARVTMLASVTQSSMPLLHQFPSRYMEAPFECSPAPLQVESYFGNVNPIGERSCYDEGKRAAETLTFDYKREHGLEVTPATETPPTAPLSAVSSTCTQAGRGLCPNGDLLRCPLV